MAASVDLQWRLDRSSSSSVSFALTKFISSITAMEEIIAQLDIPATLQGQTSAIAEIVDFVRLKMGQHDPSHNPQHVFRVTRLAHKLLSMERSRAGPQQTLRDNRAIHYNDLIVTLSALLHDISDHKYTVPGIDAERYAYETLIKHGYDEDVSEKVQTIVSNVSFSKEKRNPGKPQELIDNGFPELAIVQDADRLDAIGAVGVGRCFTYLGAKRSDEQTGRWELDMAIEHFVEKLETLKDMMKTESGRELAEVRTQRLREFRGWWAEETGFEAKIA
ncbi:hypothetical protein KEM56_006236 [Ascosphaera pollenicola]|nr:hypothetical protein KEM56_006236 [Ascosphaera pollenicola]